MLTPKKEIAVIYGHDKQILELIEAEIRSFEKRGYRVKPVILNSKQLRVKKGLVFQAFLDLFKDIDAAIVFMTDDDFGISKNDLEKLNLQRSKLGAGGFVKSHLKRRARQNVIFEMGFIIAHLGEGKYRIFSKEGIEVPSDIQGRYLERDFSRDNIVNVLKEMLEINLDLSPVPNSIDDTTYKMRYSVIEEFVRRGGRKGLLNYFDEEYERLDDEADKLIYLSERIVFDSYYQNPDWWQSRYRDIEEENAKIKLGKLILEEISRYMRSWRPPETTDYSSLHTCASQLSGLVDDLDGHQPLNPVIEIIACNYLGLACHKMGTHKGLSDAERIAMLDKATRALETVIKLAESCDDPQLQLWKG